MSQNLEGKPFARRYYSFAQRGFLPLTVSSPLFSAGLVAFGSVGLSGSQTVENNLLMLRARDQISTALYPVIISQRGTSSQD